MDTLSPRDDLLPSDKDIKGIAVLAIAGRRHRVEWSYLHQRQDLVSYWSNIQVSVSQAINKTVRLPAKQASQVKLLNRALFLLKHLCCLDLQSQCN